ncbi:hypothetical protein UR09_00335 [Candidatus Nitromaritima sp. SCGC AAA799-A02]|nr:hypothetical protein UR09_00335 [Candidatus Nitromaritima sp. SCGC AAA799-A02]
MDFHKVDKPAGRLSRKAINVYEITRGTASSCFTSQWKLLELKRHLDKKPQALLSPAYSPCL